MADKIPVIAGVKPNGTFVYSKELSGTEKLDSAKISYDTLGNNYLIHDNLSENLDVMENTFDAWNSAKTLTTFEVFLQNPITLYPCHVDIKIPFDTVSRDSDSGWDALNTKWVAQKSGYYLIESSIKIDLSNVVGGYLSYYQNKIYINGAPRVDGHYAASMRYQASAQYSQDNSRPVREVSSLEYLNAGDEVEIYIWREEIYRVSNGYTCATEPNISTYNYSFGYTHDEITNFLSINMVYSG